MSRNQNLREKRVLQSAAALNLSPRDQCIYTPCYCEENVWFLCRSIMNNEKGDHECYCVFVSNSAELVCFSKQKADHLDEHTFCWDYHVFVVYGRKDEGYVVYDLNTILPFPTLLETYMEESCQPGNNISCERFFRVIPALIFLDNFSSDRRHMKLGNRGWISPPPSYPPIINKVSEHNLKEFIDMTKNKGYGTVYTQDEFLHRFSSA